MMTKMASVCAYIVDISTVRRNMQMQPRQKLFFGNIYGKILFKNCFLKCFKYFCIFCNI